jgi:predicted TIM-barrel fold metal-dependent hydrolase
MLEACSETDTVICLHIGSASRSPRSADDSPPGANITLTSVNSQYAMTDWVMSGALARYPRLKLAFSESQVGWMPYHFQRMDVVWKNHHGSPVADIPAELTSPPSSYAKGRIFGCIVEDDFGIEVRGGPLGTEQLTFESDYPHMDSTWPNTLASAEHALASYSDEDVEKVVRGNAIKLFQLPEHLSN